MRQDTATKLSRAANQRKRDKKGRFKAGAGIASAPMDSLSPGVDESIWDSDLDEDEREPWEIDPWELNPDAHVKASAAFEHRWQRDGGLEGDAVDVLLAKARACGAMDDPSDIFEEAHEQIGIIHNHVEAMYKEAGYNVCLALYGDGRVDEDEEVTHPGGPWVFVCGVHADPELDTVYAAVEYQTARRCEEGWRLEYDHTTDLEFWGSSRRI